VKNKTILKTITIMMLAAFTITVNAAMSNSSSNSNTTQWNGTSQLQPSTTYTVSEKLYINENVTIPANTTLRILDGGELIFITNTTLDLRGDLQIYENGKLFTSGSFTAQTGSVLNINGDLLCSISSRVDIATAMTIGKTGSVKTSGEFNLHKSSNLNNTGTFRTLSSSAVTLSGNYKDNESSRLRVGGKFNISRSGTAEINGRLFIAENGEVVNSGIVKFEVRATLDKFGSFTTTKSGQSHNMMMGVNRFLYTGQAISRKPAVTKHGIDVSRWQGDIEWESVSRSGIEFVMMRAGVGSFEGNPIAEDSRFREYYRGAKRNRIEVGVYFYSYAQTIEEIKEEAHFLADTLKNFSITYPVALDMEEKREHYIDSPSEMAEAFLEIIVEAGYFPMLYSYKSWLEDYLTRETRDKYSVWVGHIDVPATTYRGRYHMWQYSHTGKVSGIEGDVDLNIAYRDFGRHIRENWLNNLR
jgi:GH25 family lysozyme M1 (1,4-beta-N-acetylmuramidase)